MPRYEAAVDPDLCTGAQMCVSVAPHAFTFDTEEFHSRAEVGAFPDDDAVREAAENCPVEAITLRDADTGVQLFP
jgi:ferredoxin